MRKKPRVERCMRCSRRWRGADDWNSVWKSGVLTGLLCPDCQTPEENAEAEINAVGLDYDRMHKREDGHWYVPEKDVI
ncbi:hypothetical protein [Cellulomonas sp. ES6]|uniref:hypothetical protein n=1 Tax=Cellulomonas sp. ES6 TaxID=3039384 RepID=UPI0024B85EAD|nr:hypothetical protein [Cellulomonas sp. ES6]WHP18814.1 hypothetical protein P9841_06775 [Cellulomonas sp. ES6]